MNIKVNDKVMFDVNYPPNFQPLKIGRVKNIYELSSGTVAILETDNGTIKLPIEHLKKIESHEEQTTQEPTANQEPETNSEAKGDSITITDDEFKQVCVGLAVELALSGEAQLSVTSAIIGGMIYAKLFGDENA